MEYNCPGCGATEKVPASADAAKTMAEFAQKHMSHNSDTPQQFK